MGAAHQEPLKQPTYEARPFDLSRPSPTGADQKQPHVSWDEVWRGALEVIDRKPDIFEGGKHYVWCPGCRQYIKDKMLFGTLHVCC